MPAHADTLVLLDGDLPAMVALGHVTERQGSRGSGDPIEVLVCAWVGGDDSRARLSAIRRQVGLYGGEFFEPRSMPDGLSEGLLGVLRLAAERRTRRIVWPAHAGVALDPESLDVDRAAGIVERTLLIERLAAIDDPVSPSIDAPFADLTDAQIAELAIDLAVPVSLAWWWGRQGDAAADARERWERAWSSIGATMGAPLGDTDAGGRLASTPGRSRLRG